MRTCLGEAQIARCGCANAQYAFEKKHVCDIIDDDTTGYNERLLNAPSFTLTH